jgi:hypothetical protein
MKKKLIATILLLLPIFLMVQNVYAETIPTADLPKPYDEELNIYHATIGQRRQTQPLPYGQWYTNLNFDYDSSNYAKVGVGGYAYLRAYSYATFFPDCHGWSNAYFHQGRVPYSGGIYEGKFKGYFTGVVDGIRYQLWDGNQIHYELEGADFLTIRVKITKRYVNSINAFASILFFALFQYEYNDGTLSKYDYPQFTNDEQSLHYDIFLSRACRSLGWYWEDSAGTETTDWGDAYNGDLHVQRVVGQMNVGSWYTFTLDWGFLVNRAKIMLVASYMAYKEQVPTHINAIILRWIGLSAEVIGSELECIVDYIRFSTSRTQL